MKENGYKTLYICVWVGLTQTRPILLSLSAVWSGSIRSVGLGFLPVGFWLPFNFLSFSCYVHPCVCYLDLLCVLTSLRNPKKIVMRSWYICDCFVIFYMWKLIKIWQVLVSHLIGIFCVFYKFSRMFAYPNFCPMILVD